MEVKLYELLDLIEFNNKTWVRQIENVKDYQIVKEASIIYKTKELFVYIFYKALTVKDSEYFHYLIIDKYLGPNSWNLAFDHKKTKKVKITDVPDYIKFSDELWSYQNYYNINMKIIEEEKERQIKALKLAKRIEKNIRTLKNISTESRVKAIITRQRRQASKKKHWGVKPNPKVSKRVDDK